jgi:hypothetical protein
MRTTLAIDDDVLALARARAASENRTIGEVVSDLARQGLKREPATAASRNGVPLLAGRADAPPVTMELVNQLRDEAP